MTKPTEQLIDEERLNLRKEYNDPALIALIAQSVAQHDATYHPINQHNTMVKSDEEARVLWKSEGYQQAIKDGIASINEAKATRNFPGENPLPDYDLGLSSAIEIIASLQSKVDK